ncbi:22337_t:CDS:2, partial [Entrophospora sp. SA101]
FRVSRGEFEKRRPLKSLRGSGYKTVMVARERPRNWEGDLPNDRPDRLPVTEQTCEKRRDPGGALPLRASLIQGTIIKGGQPVLH